MQNEDVRPLVGEIPVNISGKGVATTISLDGADVDEDIYRFLDDSFRKLRLRYSTFLQPTKTQLERLANRAGRRFIVAATMMKFIDDRHNDPRGRLALMLELTSQLLPGTEVYKLYDLILSTCADPTLAYMHLSVVAVLADPLPISQISELLGPGQGRDVEKVLVQLRSVIDLPTDSSLPVNICHSSVRDYVSQRSNCCLHQVRYIISPHSLIALSSLNLMVLEIPESTALLKALSKLMKHSQAIQPQDPQHLKQSLSFIVQPPDPMQVLIALLWLRGDYGSELQFWLESLDGRAWLRTTGVNDWLLTQKGTHWLLTDRGKEWLQTEGRHDWLSTEAGRDWLQTDAGKDWRQTDGQEWWLQTRIRQDWLSTEAGRDWLQTDAVQYLLQTESGQEWLDSHGGRNWLETVAGRDWLQTDAGKDWLVIDTGRHRHSWLWTQGGRDWLETEAGKDWLQTDGQQWWSQTQGVQYRLETEAGQDWLQTDAGRDWLQTDAGKDWLLDDADWWHDRLLTKGGKDWLETEAGKDWLETEAGKDWLETEAGKFWQRNSGIIWWLQTQGGQDWLETEAGKDWLWLYGQRWWLDTQGGKHWLETEAGRDWLQTENGQDWLVLTQGGQDWLQTQSGQDWLQNKGRDWLQTPYGKAWRLNTVWVTMEEFWSTFNAIRDCMISPVLSLHPAFQVIQQFKALPDFLMFPVFLALRHQGNSTTATPDLEIIHAMKAFSSFAGRARKQSQLASGALNYACQNWAVHLSRTPKPWDEKLSHVFQSFWDHNLVSWLERQWCLRDLPSCLTILSDGEKLAKVLVFPMIS
ncbi:hypothetical protein CY34DRAFT_17872 [Suillus luteus UH-Slu-Lm8-n1]|uniref:Uncharacterized protein n=1 Tax=Suillus luteus UH-Slu-Lm8-n1 TaxID=930992 RepID=A0A0D0AQD6_9AGAM|nr:hypothetical protein CY34DRAFT_17872 [Suillus luteus UH-Slu-Lm8-n1]